MAAPDAEVELLKFLAVKDEELRGAVLVARGKLKRPAKVVVPKFIELLKTENTNIQFWTIRTLWDMGPDAAAATSELVALLSPHPSSFIDRLREMRNSRDNTSRRTIRFYSAAALAVISPSTPEIPPVLTEMMGEWDYRWLGITSLGKIGRYAVPALPALHKFLTSRHKIEAKAAAEAIAKIKEEGLKTE